MARSVPLGELPNVDWLLKTAGVIVELIVNFVASLPAWPPRSSSGSPLAQR